MLVFFQPDVDKTRQDETGRDEKRAREEKPWRGKASQDRSRHDKSRQDKIRQERTRIKTRTRTRHARMSFFGMCLQHVIEANGGSCETCNARLALWHVLRQVRGAETGRNKVACLEGNRGGGIRQRQRQRQTRIKRQKAKGKRRDKKKARWRRRDRLQFGQLLLVCVRHSLCQSVAKHDNADKKTEEPKKTRTNQTRTTKTRQDKDKYPNASTKQRQR